MPIHDWMRLSLVPTHCFLRSYDMLNLPTPSPRTWHWEGQLKGRKILRAWYFWPSLFRDAHDYVKRCDACQRYARMISEWRCLCTCPYLLSLLRSEKLIMWGKSTPTPQRTWLILLWPLSTWPNGRKPKRSRPIQHLMLLTSCMRILFLDFGCPKILVSDRGTHFMYFF